jgi:hypothetical protein
VKSHELKTWPMPFSAIWEGKKRFEIRLNDRGFEVGDTLILTEWNEKTGKYTGRLIVAVVTFLLGYDEELPGVRPGYVCLSIDVQRTQTTHDDDPFAQPASLPIRPYVGLRQEGPQPWFGPVVAAQFESLCNECDEEIETGDPIRVGPSGAVHNECAYADEPTRQ